VDEPGGIEADRNQQITQMQYVIVDRFKLRKTGSASWNKTFKSSRSV